MISKFFIERPVLANVLAIVLVLIGGVALFVLPVSQYPNVVPPTVQVTTRYPGASAQTVVDTVALPIELQVNGVDKMIYMQSTSASDGTYTLTVTFEIGTDLDFAQVLVQNRVSTALASLPTSVQAQGVTVQKKSTAILLIVALTSPGDRFDSLYMSNYATINLVNEIARLPGVGNVNVFGVGEYAMRVWMDPQKLYARGLMPKDVIDVIKQQSQQVAAGQVGAPPAPKGQDFQYTVDIEGRLDDPAQFSNIVVKSEPGQGGRITRLKDVATVELGAQTYSQQFRLNGKQSAGIAVFQTPDANALDVANRVEAKMKELGAAFPEGLQYSIPFNTTEFVTTSINEVYKTLIEAGILVLVVILLFLQNFRATLVPATTVPVTIIGAFAAMAALGFTINLSTLFGIVLAIGIVVDDAIVIVEGVTHHIERGMSGHDAAVKAMNELFGPIIGITLVLMSVFIPASFLPGLTGKMFAQFALVIAATALISAINAATLKPTQCALWLRAPTPPEQRNFFYRGFNRVYGAMENGYVAFIDRMVHHSGLMVVIALIIAGVGIYGLARLPTAFIPNEDQGYALVGVQLPDGASLERTAETLDEVTRIVREVPGVDQVVAISGISVLDNSASLANAGVAYVILKDWSVREKAKGQDLRSILENMRRRLDDLPDGNPYLLVPPPIQGIGNSGGFSMQVELRDGSFDYDKLLRVTNAIVDEGNSQSSLQRLVTSFRADVPQLRVTVDRSKAESMKVSVGEVFSTLASYLGSSYVNQFNKFGLTFQVYVQAASEYRLQPDDLLKLYVRSEEGNMVPIGALAQIEPVVGPSLISLFNLYLSSTVVGAPARGYSSGQAMSLMEQIATRTLPPGMGFEWSGMSYQEKAVGNQLYYAFGLAILLVYLCLAGQYESWITPFAVILAVPLSLMGPVIALTSLGLANNIYTQIGLMLLIALSAKNAILIVEVARERRNIDGRSITEAAVEASRTRFRPILMTSIAFILGVLPLVTATGAGANSRISLGICVFSGMIASTCLAVLFVPSYFTVLQRFEEWRKARKQPKAPTGRGGGLSPSAAE
ncbi:MAG: multidrug efflux RND transporter permease subunit [Xanthobacteraceae bacterium]